MPYKLIFFLLLLFANSHTQSFFYKTIGNTNFSKSPQSLGLGNNIGLVSKNGYSLNGNPANLINKDKRFTFYLNNTYEGISERRSFILKDSFGDFLVDADYVVNLNKNFKFASGLTINNIGYKNLISIGFNFSPIISLNSTYREEVRGDVECPDDYPCTRDVLLGYHNFKTDGSLNAYSIGIATSLSNLKIGFSILNTLSSKISYQFMTDTLHTELSNLSPIQKENDRVKINQSNSFKVGVVYEDKNGIDFSVFYHNSLNLKVDGSYPIGYLDNQTGLIKYIFNDDSLHADNENIIELYKSNSHIVLPTKSGFSIGYTPKYLQKTSIYFEFIDNKYSKPTLVLSDVLIDSSLINTPTYTLKNYNELKLGIEYSTVFNSVLRLGLSYNQLPVENLNSMSILTFGYGKHINNIDIDFGVSYRYNNYQYPDIFPVEDDPRPDYDNVKESIFNISTSIQYSF